MNSATPSRPTVLLLDGDVDRRKVLIMGLAEVGYEAIPVTSAVETLRFARGLGPSVVVGPFELLQDATGALLELCESDASIDPTVLFFGFGEAPDDLPDEVRYLAVDGLESEEIRRRILLVLAGRELGLDTDLDLEFLTGDLSMIPFLDLARGLNRCRLTGRMEMGMGSVALSGGEILAVRADGASGINHRGKKAFCRLARKRSGPFRVFMAPTTARAELDQDLDSLMIEAIEEMHIDWPDPRTRVRVTDGAAGSDHLLLRTVASCETLGELFDLIPTSDAQTLEALRKMVDEGHVRLEPPRSPVTVVTDSSSDIPPELARAHGIEVVPLSILFGDQKMQDGVELRPRDFYQMLETEDDHPQTEPPSEDVFREHYRQILEQQDVLSLHISGRLSKTPEHARQAASRCLEGPDSSADRENLHLEVVDTHQVSMGIGLLALFAARMIERGETVASVRERVEAMSPRIHTLFVVDTLEFLARGGRIGTAQAWVGKLLGIKPILGVVDGQVAPVDKVRGGRRAHPRIVQILEQRLDPRRPIVAAVAHAQAPMWCDRLSTLLEERFEVGEKIVTYIGPVVGTHAGPGCVGTVVFQPTEEEWPLISPLA